MQWKHWNYELRNSYSDIKFTQMFLGRLRIIPEMEHDLFPTGNCKVVCMNHHNI